MRTQSMDTSPEAEHVQIELIRKASIAKRFTIMEAWSQFLIEANKLSICRNHPDLSEEEVGLIFVANNYGQALANRLPDDLSGENDERTKYAVHTCRDNAHRRSIGAAWGKLSQKPGQDDSILPWLLLSAHLPSRNANKLFAAGVVAASTNCAAKVITIRAAVIRAIDAERPIGVDR